MSAHFVYRIYDAGDRLLYVGCTSNVKRRMCGHRAGRNRCSLWVVTCMSRYEVSEPIGTRNAALVVEARAIVEEHPVFNLQHGGAPIWQWMPRVAHYLIDHGHLQLALDTACACWRETREAGGFDDWCPAHVHEAAMSSSAA